MVSNPPPVPYGQVISMVGVDCSIIMKPKVWEASGHVGGFQDPMAGCKYCKKLFRADQIWPMLIESPWVKNLIEYVGKKRNAPTTTDLRYWVDSKGKKLAPNLALVRNFDVTISWLAQEIEATGGHAYAFSDARVFLHR